ncbi:MAG: hypothetical protein R3C05_07740 [Pirellulaceae bacterium]
MHRWIGRSNATKRRQKVDASRRGGRSAKRRLLHEALSPRQMLAGDVALRFEFVNESATPLDTLQVGQPFRMNVHIRDARPTNPQGVFQAYMDLNYPAPLANVTSTQIHTDDFSAFTRGTVSTDGLVNDAGGFIKGQAAPSPPGKELLLFSIPMIAEAAGTFTVTADAADDPTLQVLLFDRVAGETFDNIDLLDNSIEIVATGLIVNASGSLVTNEAATQSASFELSLSNAPTSPVTVQLASNDATEGTVSPTTISFNASNWNVPRTITVNGVDDSIDDGNVSYAVTITTASSDTRFNNLPISPVAITNLNNDTAGITILDADGGLTTRESGSRTDTFRVVLNSQPTANVTIPLSTSNALEGTLSTNQLVFTSSNWNTPQTVTVTGQPDSIDDGDKTYQIVLAKPTGSDTKYTALASRQISVTNVDTDTAGVTITPVGGVITGEDGRSATFNVRLNSRPVNGATVAINLTSSDPTEGTLSVSTLSFNTSDWSTPKSFTVTGVNDQIDDDDIAYTINTSSASTVDPLYNGLDIADVALTNEDDGDTAGFVITPAGTLTTNESGAQRNATFTIRLQSQPLPNQDVTVSLMSSDSSEGTVSPSSQTFNSSNWNTPRTITVSGVNDSLSDGDIDYFVQATSQSSDSKYGNLSVTVPVTNIDDDPAGITVSRTSGLRTTEGGATDTFNVRLDSQPTGNVVITLSSSDSTEGTVSPSPLTFTTANWNVAQTVTLSGVDDAGQDGDVGYTINLAVASSDPAYNNLAAPSVSAVNADNEVNVMIAPVGSAVTTEQGGQATFSVTIDKQPTSNVTIGLSSSDTTEGTVSPTSIVFTPQNWQTPKTFTVTGVNDGIDDDDVSYTIVTAPIVSSDPNYGGVNPADVTVVNQDDADTAGVVVVSPTELTTTESGGTATFTVALRSQPTAPVTIDLESSNTAEGTVSPIQLSFTTGNWNVPQTVTVTGVNDPLPVDDGDIAYAIVLDVQSADAKYNDFVVANVPARNVNNDAAGVTVSPLTGLATSEEGTSATFTVRLIPNRHKASSSRRHPAIRVKPLSAANRLPLPRAIGTNHKPSPSPDRTTPTRTARSDTRFNWPLLHPIPSTMRSQ